MDKPKLMTVLIIVMAVMLVLLVIYDMIMIGLMSQQVAVAKNYEKDLSEKRSAVKSRYLMS
jgi:hypothetical protein